MLSFRYRIKDENGIHARTAAILVKEDMKYESKVLVRRDDRTADAAHLMEMMELTAEYGQTVEVVISGADEKDAYRGMKRVFEKNI